MNNINYKICSCKTELTDKNSTYIGKEKYKNKVIMFFICDNCKSTFIVKEKGNIDNSRLLENYQLN